MTNPTPATPLSPAPLTPAEQFRADMMSALAAIRAELALFYGDIDAIQSDIAAIRDGLASASQPATHASGVTQTITATSIIMTYDDKGQPSYKILGPPFAKFGVRVWPEVLPALGIDPATLKPGPNPINLAVRVQMQEHTAEDGTVKLIPQKVTGRA